MDMELYAELTDSIEYALDEADFAAKESKVRFSGTDVFRLYNKCWGDNTTVSLPTLFFCKKISI